MLFHWENRRFPHKTGHCRVFGCTKIDLNEGLAVLMKFSAPSTRMIETSSDGSFDTLYSNETYVCNYEESLSDDNVVKKEIKQIIDEKMTLSIEKELCEYRKIFCFLEDDSFHLTWTVLNA